MSHVLCTFGPSEDGQGVSQFEKSRSDAVLDIEHISATWEEMELGESGLEPKTTYRILTQIVRDETLHWPLYSQCKSGVAYFMQSGFTCIPS